MAKTGSGSAKKATQMEMIDAVYKASMRTLRGQENRDVAQLARAYRSAQSEILGEIQDAIRQAGGAGKMSFAEFQRTGRYQSLLDSITDRLGTLAQKSADDVEAASIQQFRGSQIRTTYALDQATPPNVLARFAEPPETAVRIVINTPFKGAMFSQRIGLITNAMASDIRDNLAQGLIQGEGIRKISKRIEKTIGATNLQDPRGYANRATTIARTEIVRAQELARELTYEQNKDIIKSTEWYVTPDDRLCPWCLRREGKSDSEIKKMPTKGDPWGNSTTLPLHPRCRCTKAPVMRSWKDLLGVDMPENFRDDSRGMRGDDGRWRIQPTEAFNSWAKKKEASFSEATRESASAYYGRKRRVNEYRL